MTLKELLKKENTNANDDSEIIKRLKQGRSQATPDMALTITGLEPSQHAIYDELKRPDKKIRRDADENQAVKVSSTGEEIKEYDIVPVERIALAIQKLIVNRAVAFLFGNAPTNSADLAEDTKEGDVLYAVNKMLQRARAKSLNRKIARSLFETTEAAEYWYPAEQPKTTRIYGFPSKFKIKVAVFSPENGDSLYPYFDNDGELLAFSREYEVRLDETNRQRTFETYTAKQMMKWVVEDGTWQMAEGYPKANPIGKIPVVYCCQPKREWDDVQSLIERLETLLSNFADTNDYHSSPKIFTTGTILGWAKKGESGAVIEGEEGATAQYLSWSQAPESVKLEIETLLRFIYTITQTPDVSFDSVKGLNISGVALKLLFMDAHLKVQDKAAEIFDEYLQRRNSILQAFAAQMNASDNEFVESCENLFIEPEIHPYMIEDDTTKVSTLMAATGQKPIASQKLAIQRLGWSKDPDAELEEIEAQEAAAATFDITEPTL